MVIFRTCGTQNSNNRQKNEFGSPPTKYINGYKSTTIHLNDMFVTYKSFHIISLDNKIKKMHMFDHIY